MHGAGLAGNTINKPSIAVTSASASLRKGVPNLQKDTAPLRFRVQRCQSLVVTLRFRCAGTSAGCQDRALPIRSTWFSLDIIPNEWDNLLSCRIMDFQRNYV